MLNGEPLREDALIRSFNRGIGCHVALSLEEALLLPNDMAELQNIKRMRFYLTSKVFGHGMILPPSFSFFIYLFIYYVANPFLLGYTIHFQG